MEQIISPLIALLSPILVKVITSRVKDTVAGTEKTDARKMRVRLFVAVLSIAISAANAFLTEKPIDDTQLSSSVETIVEIAAYSLYAGAGAHMLYSGSPKKEEEQS